MREELQLQTKTESKETGQLRILRGMPGYHDKIAEQNGEQPDEGRIRYVMPNLPTTCLHNCKKCSQVKEREKMKKSDQPRLSKKERHEFIKYAQQLGAKELVIIGEGEPMQKQNWNFYIKPLIEDWVKINTEQKTRGGVVLFTTAFFLTENQAIFCRDNNVTLMISLDTLDNDKYRDLDGTDETNDVGQNYLRLGLGEEKGLNQPILDPADRVKANLKMLKKVYDDAPVEKLKTGETVTRLGINTTIQVENENELDELREFAHSLGFYYGANYLMPKGNAGSLDEDDKAEHEKFIKQVGSMENWQKHKQLAEEKSDSGGHSSIKEGVCNYFADGIACDVYGNLITCGYASATANKMENVKNMKSAEQMGWIVKRNRIAYKLWCKEMDKLGLKKPEDDGPSCPLRSEDYQRFIEFLDQNRITKASEKEMQKKLEDWLKKGI